MPTRTIRIRFTLVPSKTGLQRQVLVFFVPTKHGNLFHGRYLQNTRKKNMSSMTSVSTTTLMYISSQIDKNKTFSTQTPQGGGTYFILMSQQFSSTIYRILTANVTKEKTRIPYYHWQVDKQCYLQSNIQMASDYGT